MGKTIKILAVYTAIVLLGAFLLKDFTFFHTAINLITALVMFGVVLLSDARRIFRGKVRPER